MVGQTLGHYKILDKLGAGGMGEVYRAEDTTLDREVALKILPPELAESQERLDRFVREAKTLAALDHPNIVHIHTVEEEEGVHFLTMQLVEGKPLSHLITKGGMPLERIFEIAIPLADALATAHEKGVIHRDLKPANIMVTEEGRVKVLDFGLAKLREEAGAPLSTELPTEPLTEEGRIVGTMPYMSPEQLEGKEIDARSDVFSLGVVLYEMATGERPFKGDSSASLIMAIGRDSPPDVDSKRQDLPHHLGRVVRRCLEKSPERRFQSAKDVRNELEDLDREESSQSTGLPVPVPGAQQARKTWLVASVAIVLLLLGASLAQLFLGDGFLREAERIKDPKARLLFEQANQYRLSGFRKSTAVLAEQNLRGALEIEPDNPLLQGELAYLLSVMHRLYDPVEGRVEEASFLAAEALRSDPRSLEAWWAKSILLRSRDDKDSAIQAATRAMEINQEKVRSYICLGNALIDNGEVDEGLEYLRKGIDKEGGAVYARQVYATALIELGRLDEAIVENKKVLELAPGHPEALNNLGGCYLYSGRYLESVPYFRRLLDLYPDADAASNLGVAYHYLGRMMRQLRHIFKRTTLGPATPRSSSTWAMRLGQWVMRRLPKNGTHGRWPVQIPG